jgi:hypothetical protein
MGGASNCTFVAVGVHLSPPSCPLRLSGSTTIFFKEEVGCHNHVFVHLSKETKYRRFFVGRIARRYKFGASKYGSIVLCRAALISCAVMFESIDGVNYVI